MRATGAGGGGGEIYGKMLARIAGEKRVPSTLLAKCGRGRIELRPGSGSGGGGDEC